jgi:hypothetical protein
MKFWASNNYDEDSMMNSRTITYNKLWQFLGRLWPIEYVMYHNNPSSDCVILKLIIIWHHITRCMPCGGAWAGTEPMQKGWEADSPFLESPAL